MAIVGNFYRLFRRVTLIGGAATSPATLEQCLSHAPELMGVDGGANQALRFGHIPLAISGDMDSVSEGVRDQIDPARFIATPDQDFTDFHKALGLIDATIILAAGFMGQRVDHELACYNTLVRLPEKPVIMVGDVDICFHLSKSLVMELPVGTRFSLFPMKPVVVRATGLRWPVEDLEMSPWGRTGTSNETVDSEVRVHAQGDGLLVILPKAHLADAIKVVQNDQAR